MNKSNYPSRDATLPHAADQRVITAFAPAGKRRARRYDRRVSHPDPSAPADLAPIEPGEVWENPVTGERAVVLELPWESPEGRGVAELTASRRARHGGASASGAA